MLHSRVVSRVVALQFGEFQIQMLKWLDSIGALSKKAGAVHSEVSPRHLPHLPTLGLSSPLDRYKAVPRKALLASVFAGAAYVALFFLVAVPTSTTHAQCTGVCGDLDSSGFVTSADVLALFPYISSADSTGLDLGCANVDDHAGLMLRDFVFLSWDAYLSWSLDCEINSGPFVPPPNAGYKLLHNSVYPAGDTAVTLYVDATFGNSTQAVAFVLRVLVNGEIPSFGDVAPDTSYLSSWDLFAFNASGTGNIPAGHLMGAFISFDFVQAEPGRHPLGRAEVIMPAAAQARVITLEQVEVPLGSNKTMAVEGNVGNTDTWALSTAPWIIDVTGDFNNDRVLTSSDIIGLVNFVFKSGPAPYPYAATGDVNCSGSVSSSDIIGLVNHVFKSASAPCDVASECTLTLTSWTCP